MIPPGSGSKYRVLPLHYPTVAGKGASEFFDRFLEIHTDINLWYSKQDGREGLQIYRAFVVP